MRTILGLSVIFFTIDVFAGALQFYRMLKIGQKQSDMSYFAEKHLRYNGKYGDMQQYLYDADHAMIRLLSKNKKLHTYQVIHYYPLEKNWEGFFFDKMENLHMRYGTPDRVGFRQALWKKQQGKQNIYVQFSTIKASDFFPVEAKSSGVVSIVTVSAEVHPSYFRLGAEDFCKTKQEKYEKCSPEGTGEIIARRSGNTSDLEFLTHYR